MQRTSTLYKNTAINLKKNTALSNNLKVQNINFQGIDNTFLLKYESTSHINYATIKKKSYSQKP
jgi:hypothetical protein